MPVSTDPTAPAPARLREYLEQLCLVDDGVDPCDSAIAEIERLGTTLGHVMAKLSGVTLDYNRLRTAQEKSLQAEMLRWVRMHRSGWAEGLREALRFYMANPELSTMEILERAIFDIDARGDMAPTSLEHIAGELDAWIELAHEIVDPEEPCTYHDLRDAIRGLALSRATAAKDTQAAGV